MKLRIFVRIFVVVEAITLVNVVGFTSKVKLSQTRRWGC